MKKPLKSKNVIEPIPTFLIILDGFGLAPENPYNAITPKTAPHIFSYMRKYPFAKLKAHGRAVGLARDQEGNSEAGHFAIGAGRVVEQDLVMVSKAIKDKTFFKNTAFKEAIDHVKKNKSTLHLLGLLTDGQSAHAHPDHVYALLDLCDKEKVPVALHLFTDGRDASPHEAVHFLADLEKRMKKGQCIASVCGRFYAMDRNKLWDRTARAYHAIVCGEASYRAATAGEAIAKAYNRGETDEYIQPTIIAKNKGDAVCIKDSDAIIFFNARSDRARQLAKAFVQKDFNRKNSGAFRRSCVVNNVVFVAMTDFGPDLDHMLTAFPSKDIPRCLALAIGEKYKQLYLSETEKYAHVTYFINGGFANPINGEHRELVRSTNTYSYITKPSMMSRTVCRRALAYISNGTYNFICVNFPNADMLGHTGDMEATKKAVQAIDAHVNEMITHILKMGGQAIIVADHGNAEHMLDEVTGELFTEHTVNPVPCIVVADRFIGKRMKQRGSLIDVAPTLLKIMGIKKPKEMTGESLL